jgi:hypothetical protein
MIEEAIQPRLQTLRLGLLAVAWYRGTYVAWPRAAPRRRRGLRFWRFAAARGALAHGRLQAGNPFARWRYPAAPGTPARQFQAA